MGSQERVIQFKVRVPVAVKKDGKWFIASCALLDVHSQGQSKEDAIHNLVEALQLFIESCLERGTLDQVLKECGFAPSHEQNRESEENHFLDVPVTLLAAKHATEARCG